MSQDKSTKKFMFGVVVRKADTGKAWAERARLVEQSGFTTLLMPDHFVGPRFAPIAALTSVLGQPKLRIDRCSLWPDRADCAQRCTRYLA